MCDVTHCTTHRDESSAWFAREFERRVTVRPFDLWIPLPAAAKSAHFGSRWGWSLVCDAFMCVWRDSFMCVDMTHSYACDSRIHMRHSSYVYVWYGSFMCVTWHIHVCVTWLIYTCDMTRSYVGHDLIQWAEMVSGVTHSCVCDMTRLYAWHGSSIGVTWLIHTCHTTYLVGANGLWCDAFMCVWYDSSMRVTCLIHTWDMTYLVGEK